MAQQARRKKAAQGEAVQQVEEAPEAASSGGPRADRLSGRGKAVLAGVLLLLNLPILHHFLRGRPEAGVPVPWADDFSEPSTLERHYFSTGGQWRVVNGELLSPGVRNNPLWLKARLPENVAVEFDVRAEFPENDPKRGDVKAELFGNGRDHASGYVFIHGGWGNALSIIARLDEHGRPLRTLETEARRVAREQALPEADLVATGVFAADTHMRVEANPFPVQRGRTYHWRLERRDGHLRWSIDGQPFMDFRDPLPLRGPDHDRFGFSSWDSDLYFDNLKVTPL